MQYKFREMTLADLQFDESAIITKVKGRGAFRKRVTDMGFVRGKKIKAIKAAPLKDPIEYSILDYEISLRRNEAKLIEVIAESEVETPQNSTENPDFKVEDILRKNAITKSKTINIALVGNPNSGKTSFFNFASHSQEHVGNYSGVTVDAKATHFKHKGYKINLTDLPGTYSLTAYSPEELYVRKHILNELPDIIINIVDASNLERNLYLTTQLIDMDIKIVMALNMFDELGNNGHQLDFLSLGKMLGIPIVPTVSSKGTGIRNVLDRVVEVFEDRSDIQRFVRINYGQNLEDAITEISKKLESFPDIEAKVSPRFVALKIMEDDPDIKKELQKLNFPEKQTRDIEKIELTTEKRIGENIDTYIADSRYGFIAGALKETLRKNPLKRRKFTNNIDAILTHRFWGFPIFLFFMWVMFQSTFSLGQYPMDWIDMGVGWLGAQIQLWMPAGMLKDLLIDGVIGGVGGVIIFLPNILILFFFISVMEDTGYMARAAFLMDRIMHKFGLHGKSFIPLVMGFGCNVPAIMASRTLENWKDRMLTMLINPFMSCSARLPVYLVILGAFFPSSQGLILFGIYGLGIVIAGLVAILFKNTLFKGKEAPFVMELPPYRKPTLRSGLHHMWFKSKEYLKKMGGIILLASILIWALGYFPTKPSGIEKFDQKITQINKERQNFNETFETIGQKMDFEEQVQNKIQEVKTQRKTYQQENSYIGKIGHAIAPIMRPLGFDWKMSISILTGMAAKEIVVSTMGVLFQIDNADENSVNLSQKLRNEKYTQGNKVGQPVFDKIIALAFIIFVLIYFPCVATITAIKRESGSWKWAAFTAVYTTTLAYLLAFIVNNVGHLIF